MRISWLTTFVSCVLYNDEFPNISWKSRENAGVHKYIRMILQNLIKPIVAGVINISTLGRVGILHISLSWQNGKNLVLSKHFLQIEVLHLLVQLLLSTYLLWCTLTLPLVQVWTRFVQWACAKILGKSLFSVCSLQLFSVKPLQDSRASACQNKKPLSTLPLLIKVS